MNLFLLRHGIAIDRGTPGFEEDHQRPLTSKGAARIQHIAKTTKRLNLKFDLILASPFLRTQQTADIIASFYNIEHKLRLTDNLTPNAAPETLVGEINEMYGDALSILIVGHEPFLSTITSVLLTGDTNMAITYKKGGLCKLSIDGLHYGRCATLEWLLTPKQMVLE